MVVSKQVLGLSSEQYSDHLVEAVNFAAKFVHRIKLSFLGKFGSLLLAAPIALGSKETVGIL